MEITAPQVQREPLDRLHAAYGGSIYCRVRANRQPIYVWTLSGPRAVTLMTELEPLMSPARKAQIRAALDEHRTRPGTGIRNREKTHCPRGHLYDVTVHLAGGRVKRRCRECYNASMRAFQARRRA
jgi:hypothetical protein